MKKGYLIPTFILAGILAASLWISGVVSYKTAHWMSQLQTADALAQQEDWSGALSSLSDSYVDWTSQQTWLRIATKHDIVDEAEAMYHRAMAFASTKELSEFRAEISQLLTQLHILAETERFSIQNIL